MKQTIPVEIQDVLTTNDITTLLAQQRKVISYPIYNWNISFKFPQKYGKSQMSLDFSRWFYDVHVQFNIRIINPYLLQLGKKLLASCLFSY